jgi:hypothetical protein
MHRRQSVENWWKSAEIGENRGKSGAIAGNRPGIADRVRESPAMGRQWPAIGPGFFLPINEKKVYIVKNGAHYLLTPLGNGATKKENTKCNTQF